MVPFKRRFTERASLFLNVLNVHSYIISFLSEKSSIKNHEKGAREVSENGSINGHEQTYELSILKYVIERIYSNLIADGGFPAFSSIQTQIHNR